jgi:hypothetical protein
LELSGPPNMNEPHDNESKNDNESEQQ